MDKVFVSGLIHLIIAVKDKSRIDSSWKGYLNQYIAALVDKKGEELLSIDCQTDHINIIINMSPDLLIIDIMETIKEESAKWINENELADWEFNWKCRDGVISYPVKYLPLLKKFVKNPKLYQDDHEIFLGYKECLQYLAEEC